MSTVPHYDTYEEAVAAGVEEKDYDHDTPEDILTLSLEATKNKVRDLRIDPVDGNCHTDFHAFHISGTRPLGEVRWIVMHDTEGGTAFSIASYFSTSGAGGSAHLTVDDYACYRSAANNEIPWGAPGANYKGFHIEQCGYAAWKVAKWKAHMRMLNRGAYKAAYHCRLFKIPPQFVTAAGLKVGKKGITTHKQCTLAFGGTHVDPGTGWPRLLFMARVRYYHKRLASVKPIV